MCCSVTQCAAVCVALCCSVLQCVAVCCSVCCIVLQCVAVCCSVSQCAAVYLEKADGANEAFQPLANTRKGVHVKDEMRQRRMHEHVRESTVAL